VARATEREAEVRQAKAELELREIRSCMSAMQKQVDGLEQDRNVSFQGINGELAPGDGDSTASD